MTAYIYADFFTDINLIPEKYERKIEDYFVFAMMIILLLIFINVKEFLKDEAYKKNELDACKYAFWAAAIVIAAAFLLFSSRSISITITSNTL